MIHWHNNGSINSNNNIKSQLIRTHTAAETVLANVGRQHKRASNSSVHIIIHFCRHSTATISVSTTTPHRCSIHFSSFLLFILLIPQQWTHFLHIQPYQTIYRLMWIGADILQSSILFMHDIWKAYGVKTHVIHVISSIFHLANLKLFSRAHTHRPRHPPNLFTVLPFASVYIEWCTEPKWKVVRWRQPRALSMNHISWHRECAIYVFRCGVSATAVALS